MKNFFLLTTILMISSVSFSATVTLTDVYDIMDFLRKNPEALAESSACTAATGAVCRVMTIVAPDCQVTASGNQMYVTLTLKGASGEGTQSLLIACPKEMPVAH
jgi:hypothetical protein